MNDVSSIDWYKPIEGQINFDWYMPFYDLQIESIKKQAQEEREEKKRGKGMNTYRIYLDDEEQNEITVEADSFEMAKDNEYVIFKHGMQTIGFFKMCEIIGVVKE